MWEILVRRLEACMVHVFATNRLLSSTPRANACFGIPRSLKSKCWHGIRGCLVCPWRSNRHTIWLGGLLSSVKAQSKFLYLIIVAFRSIIQRYTEVYTYSYVPGYTHPWDMHTFNLRTLIKYYKKPRRNEN